MNVLLIQSDQQRRDSLGLYGNEVAATPHVDRLGREGCTFDRAFTPVPICGPARASLITGLRPVHHGILRNPESGESGGRDFTDRPQTVAERLRPLGYRSTLCGKWHVGTDLPPAACGFEGVFHPGYGYPSEHPHYLAYLERLGCSFELSEPLYARRPDASEGPLLSAVQEGSVEASVPYYVAEQACEAIRRAAERDEPFLVRCDFWGPHAPYVIPRPYAEMYEAGRMPEWENFRDGLEGKPFVQRAVRAYWGVQDFGWAEWSRLVAMCYGYVTLIDAQVGRMLETLDEAGVADETAVFYTSDHGGMVGAHGLCDKGPHLYDEQCRVPLVARVPRAPAGRRSDAVVYNMDLMPTVLDLAGAEVPAGLDARSLAPVIRGEREAVRAPVTFIEFHGHQVPYAQRLVQAGGWKYVFNAPEFDELYHLETDPGERTNRASDPACSDVLRRMRRLLRDHLRETRDPILRFYEGTRMAE
jgi:arylsulfatase A-like enzyme